MSASPEKVAEALRASVKEAQRLRRENRELLAAIAEPVAIVGMSCRLPGGASNPALYWDLIAGGSDAISALPDNRGWDIDRLYHPDPDHPGTSYVSEAGFVYDAGEFDAEFFGLTPREALAMDPQQRLFLEAGWEAIEDAAIDPHTLRGSQTGVFAGVMYQDYPPDPQFAGSGTMVTSNTGSIVSGRAAYLFGLVGPTMTVDTACSSSLVALHLACCALRRSECSMALAGGVTVMSQPGLFVGFSMQRGLAADGRCKSFADSADGTNWGEGVGVMLLERLSDAQRNGHRVLGVIRGSAVNQDGASNGFTSPNGPSQQRVIRHALASSGLSSEDVDAVEAHGTGTTLGDPIEAQALLSTYGRNRPNDRPLLLGSVKSNIGHAQAAAGVAGVMKMVQALGHEMLPRTLHVDAPTRHVDWSAGSVELLTEPRPWPRGERPRRAGVSSFGISGTNAHLIVEEPPLEQEDRGSAYPELPALPLLLSAKSEPALREQAERLRSHLDAHPDLRPLDAAFSLGTGRAQLERRAAVIATDREGLSEGLEKLARGELAVNVIERAVRGGSTAFMFTGQGAQRAGMGMELYEVLPTFALALDEACAALDPYLTRPLKELLFAAEGSPEAALLEQTEFAQASLFALELALFSLTKSLGMQPDILIGHSIGEIVAAHVAGVLSLGDAGRLVAARGKLMGALPSGGGMLAIEASEAEVLASLPRFPGLALAAVNGPRAVVVSGALEELDGLAEDWKERGSKTSRLRVSHAFHSLLMEPMLESFREVLESIELSPPKMPIVSNLTGMQADPAELVTVDYWLRHVRETVRFAQGISALRAAGVTRFLELGPDGVLSAMTRECLGQTGDECPGETAGEEALVSVALRARRGETQAFLTFAAEAYADGVHVDWRALFDGRGGRLIGLPTYAFQRRHYWHELRAGAGDLSAAGLMTADHPLLGAALALAGGRGLTFTGQLSSAVQPWLVDHAVFDTVILPGSCFVELALTAGREVGCELLEELALEAPLVLEQGATVRLQLAVEEPEDSGRRAVSVYSRKAAAGEDPEREEEWVRHAVGVLAPSADGDRLDEGLERLRSETWPPDGSEAVDVTTFYDRLANFGLAYGPAFQGVTAGWLRGEEIFAEVALGQEQCEQASRFGVHPALFDAALHAAMLGGGEGSEQGQLLLPFSLKDVRLHRTGAVSLRVRLAAVGEHRMSLAALDEEGSPVLSVGSLLARPIDADKLRAAQGTSPEWLFQLDWVKLPQIAAERPALKLAFLGDRQEASLGIVDRYADLSSLCEAIDSGDASPEAVLMLAATGHDGDDLIGAAHACVRRILLLLQEWLVEPRVSDSRLLLITRGMAARDGETPDLLAAPVWGLVRSAQSEHPGRFQLIDIDPQVDVDEIPWQTLFELDEPQLVLRDGGVYVPRLARATVELRAELPPETPGTVLLSGGTGGLGALVARHLAAKHGVRHLLLLSRSGELADGVGELVAELAELGCVAQVVACDVADRDELSRAIDAIPPDRPLTSVIHAAGVLEDGTVESLDTEQLERVMRPKLDGAMYLHELTKKMELADFVLFSSAAAVIGSPGQSSYAAANAFLDALSQHRHACGLPATSLAWGLWAEGVGMTKELDRPGMERLKRLGVDALSIEDGLRLFDAARMSQHALLVPARLDFDTLRTHARVGLLPPLLRGLVRVPARRTGAAASSLARRLDDAPEAERDAIVLELVREQIAAVLGHPSAEIVDPESTFQELGVDSLAAVELRNVLDRITGLRLPATLVFDHPTPVAVAKLLRAQVQGTRPTATLRARGRAATDEQIAIVGMSCRYPGGVRSPADLWSLVSSDTDAVSGFPADRGWDTESLYDPDPDKFGTTYVDEGGFLYDAAEFDAGFFQISPREAVAMDPQQRLLLEASWEAFEAAGIDPRSLRGSQTGVFAGVMYQDYGLSVGGGLSEGYVGNLMPGAGGSMVSGRVAYHLGLEGPAMTVDTACSSSLVALHLACQALRQGDCSLALAGGVTILSTPMAFLAFSQMRGLAADGRCKSFATAADGVGWSEGVGLVALERLSDAHRLNHPVLALVRASAINQDGASNGFTAPNGPSQERVIRQALDIAGLSPGDVDVVEAHGTGTTLGDPIEAQALMATYGQDREDRGPLWLGSVKSNLGHTQAAAGVAGLIKVVMAMRHETLPRTLHIDEPSRHVDWSAGAVSLLTEPVAWPKTDTPRRASVSSFGMTGTNAHVIVEEPGAMPFADAHLPEQDCVVPWVLSGRGESALRAQAERLRVRVAEDPQVGLADVGLALAGSRAALGSRAVLVGRREELLAGLEALALGHASQYVVEGQASRRGGAVAFLFTGQGAQRVGMGAELYAAFPVFKAALDEVCGHLDGPLRCSLREVMFQDLGPAEARGNAPTSGSVLDQTMFTQAALFALEVALFRLVESWGLRPDYLIGHSIGELAAAHVAQVFSLADACTLVAARGRLMGSLPRGGAMVAIQASEREARESLEGFEGRISLAAVNGPSSVVLSGEEDAISELAGMWATRERKTKQLTVSHAFHSHRMQDMLQELTSVASKLSFAEPRIPVVSNLSGEPLNAEQLTDPAYWAEHVRNTVRFADGVSWLRARGVQGYLELGPDGVLSAMCMECLSEEPEERDALAVREIPADPSKDPLHSQSTPTGGREQRIEPLAVPALRDGRSETRTLLSAIGTLWTHGAAVDWVPGFKALGGRRVELPTYAFQREPYWLGMAAKRSGEDADGGLENDSLFEVRWVSATAKAGGTPSRWTTLGADAIASFGSLHATGVGLEAHEDLPSLGRAIEEGLQVPDVVLASCDLVEEDGEEGAANVHRAVCRTLELIRSWLADERLVRARLVLVTRGGAFPPAEEVLPELSAAAVWGVGRSAQMESPGQFVLVDCDGEQASWSVLESALELDESQLALRDGQVWVPRLAHMSAGDISLENDAAIFDPKGTVLITGGTGGLGGLVAGHLVREHGVPHVMLVSRRGRQADGVAELEQELLGFGSQVTIAACDISDREALRALIENVPSEYPLRGIVHAAGVTDDATIGSLTSEQVERVLRPKVDGALHLHELTKHMDLSMFVMFSSVAGTFGRAGSSNYAAANAYLDALAQRRRAQGLPAVSIGWGLWAQETEILRGMHGIDALRTSSVGVGALSTEEGLRLFDRACRADVPLAVAARLDMQVLGRLIDAGMLPVLLRGLAEQSQSALPKPDGKAGSLARSLRETAQAERAGATLQAVRREVAAVLGHDSAGAIDPSATFQELGFDSLTALELRNRLGLITEIRLSATLVFNYPTSAELADYLLERIVQTAAVDPVPVDGELARLEGAIATSAMDHGDRAIVHARLLALLDQLGEAPSTEEDPSVAQELESATADQVIEFIDSRLGAL